MTLATLLTVTSTLGVGLLSAAPAGSHPQVPLAALLGEAGRSPGASPGGRMGLPAPTCGLDDVDFNESGMYNGTRWYVDLNGVTKNSTSAGISFCLSSGSYDYCAGAGTCTNNGVVCGPTETAGYNVVCGKVSFTGSLSVRVTFHSLYAPCSAGGIYGNPTPLGYYEVNFTEQGLPYGAAWAVASPGLSAAEAGWNGTTGSSLCLRFLNGTYGYTVSTQNPHWKANGGSFVVKGPATRPKKFVCGEPIGSVIVDTAVTTVPVAFVLRTYTVAFAEAGLPAGTSWKVNVSKGGLNGTIRSTGTTIDATLVNGFVYNVTASSANKDYDWAHNNRTVSVNGHDLTVPVKFNAVTFRVTFAEVNLTSGLTWSVSVPGQPVLSNTTGAGTGGTVSGRFTNGSYGYTASATGEYRAPGGSFTVNGGAATVVVPFSYAGKLPFNPPIVSEFRGPFLGDGVSNFADLLGIKTAAHVGRFSYASAVSVTGTIDGTSERVSNVGDGLFETTVYVGSLPVGAVLDVNATYPGGAYATSSYDIGVVAPPSWLVSFLSWAHGGTETAPAPPPGTWNNTQDLSLAGDFDLSQQFSVGLPIPAFAGGGSFSLIPGIDLSLTFGSGGTVTLGATFGFSSPEIDAGAVSVQVTASISASGTFQVTNSTVVWESASLTFSLSASVSVNVPIAGYTFSVPGYGDVTIGLSATITVSPSVAATIALLPSSSPGSDILPGLSVMLGSITGTIGVDLGLALNAGVGGLSITGGGDVGVSMNVQPVQPYIEGGTVTGTVYIGYQVLWWSGRLWQESGTLYSWGDPRTGAADARSVSAASSPNSTLPMLIPRYYAPYYTNPPPPLPYDHNVWTSGRTSGVAITNIYPFTDLTAADGSAGALLLYTNDDVSLPQDQGLTISGDLFNATTGTFTPVNITLPALAGEVAYDPQAVELANKSYAVVWNAIPFSGTTVASPFSLNSTILQIAYYDPTTATWKGPFDLLSKPGVSQSYSVDVDRAGVFVLDQVGAQVLSNDSSLDELNAQGKLLSSLPVEYVSRVVAFRAGSGLAVVQVDNGSFSLLNLTTDTNVSATAGLGCPIQQMSFVQGSSNMVATLLEGIPNDTLALYSGGHGSVAVTLPRNVSSMTATAYEGRVVVTVAGPFGLRVYLITGGTRVELLGQFAGGSITHLVTALSGSDLVIFTTQSFGSVKPESGEGPFSYENLDIAYVPLGSSEVTFEEKGLPNGASWSVTAGTPPVRTNVTTTSVTLPEPDGLLFYHVNGSNGYAVVSTSPATALSPLNVTGPLTLVLQFGRVGQVEFAETGLPKGTSWHVLLTPKAAGGPSDQSGTSTGEELNLSLASTHWRWKASSSDPEFVAKPSHGAVQPGKRAKVVHLRFQELTSVVKITRKGLPAHTQWSVTVQGGPTVSGAGTTLALRLPNGTYNITIATADRAYTPYPASESILITAPQRLVVPVWFGEPRPSGPRGRRERAVDT